MFRKLTIAVAVVAFAALCGVDATAENGGGDPAEPVGVNYVEAWGVGHLQIVGGAGLTMEAYSWTGMPVASGVIHDQQTELIVEPTGGLHVRVGDEFYEVSADPDFIWD